MRHEILHSAQNTQERHYNAWLCFPEASFLSTPPWEGKNCSPHPLSSPTLLCFASSTTQGRTAPPLTFHMFLSLLMSENSVVESAHMIVPMIAKTSASLRMMNLQGIGRVGVGVMDRRAARPLLSESGDADNRSWSLGLLDIVQKFVPRASGEHLSLVSRRNISLSKKAMSTNSLAVIEIVTHSVSSALCCTLLASPTRCCPDQIIQLSVLHSGTATQTRLIATHVLDARNYHQARDTCCKSSLSFPAPPLHIQLRLSLW